MTLMCKPPMNAERSSINFESEQESSCVARKLKQVLGFLLEGWLQFCKSFEEPCMAIYLSGFSCLTLTLQRQASES